MGEDPNQIRREIESTRADMGATLDEIGERVSPGRIVERRKERVRDRWQSVRTRVMGSPDTSTYPQYTGSDAYGAYGSDTGSSNGGSVMSGVRDTVASAPQQARRQAQGSPLVAGAVAFGAGLLASALLPPTETEKRAASTLQEKAQPLTDQVKGIAGEVGSNVAETAKQAGSELTEQAKSAAADVAAEAQLAAQDVKEQAQSHAEDVKSSAASSAADVKDNAQTSAQQVTDSTS